MMTEPTLPEDPAPPVAHAAPRISARRRVTIIVVAFVAITAVAVALFVFRPWAQADETAATPTPTPTPTPTGTPFATPGPQTPVALGIAPGVTDVFDDWKARTSSPDVTLQAADDAHDGSYSLRLHSQASGSQIATQYESIAHLQPGIWYTVSAWVKSSGTQSGAVEFRPGSSWEPSVSVPEGSYDWQLVSTRFQAEGSVATFRVVVSGVSEELLIDSVSYTADDGGAVYFGNGGFEHNSADLTITNPSLVLEEGTAVINLSTRRAPDGWVSWSAVDASGVEAAAGAEHFEGMAAVIPLAALDAGYYTLTIQAHIGAKDLTRVTTLGIIEERPYASELAQSPYGIHLHYGDTPERDAAMISTLASLGIGHVRADVVWNKSELVRNEYEYPSDTSLAMQALAANGMTALQVPVYANPLYDGGKTPSTSIGLRAYAAFTADVLSTFPTVGQTVEVYNEFDHFFNTGACGPSPECYIPMLDAVNAAVPDATAVGPSLAGMGFKWDWLQQFFALGGLSKIDVITAHPYTQPEPALGLSSDIERLKSMMASSGGEKPIWLTEMGWATVDNWVTDEEQAAYLVQTMAASLGTGVERVYWYEAIDQRSNPADYEGNFGIFESSTSLAPLANAPKRSAVAQSVVAQMLANKSGTKGAELRGVESYLFSDGAVDTHVMWSPDGATDVLISTTEDLTVTDIYGESEIVTPDSGKVTLRLDSTPIYVEGSGALKAAIDD